MFLVIQAGFYLAPKDKTSPINLSGTKALAYLSVRSVTKNQKFYRIDTLIRDKLSWPARR